MSTAHYEEPIDKELRNKKSINKLYCTFKSYRNVCSSRLESLEQPLPH